MGCCRRAPPLVVQCDVRGRRPLWSLRPNGKSWIHHRIIHANEFFINSTVACSQERLEQKIHRNFRAIRFYCHTLVEFYPLESSLSFLIHFTTHLFKRINQNKCNCFTFVFRIILHNSPDSIWFTNVPIHQGALLSEFHKGSVLRELFGLSLIERPILISHLNLKLIQIGRKAPHPFLLFGEILGLCCVTWCNFAKLYFMHHWTSHLGPGRRDKFPPPMPPPPPPHGQTGKNSETGSIHFMQFTATLVQLAESPPSFLPFHERPGSHHTCGIPMVPIQQIHTQIPPIRISSLGYQLGQLFKILTYRKVQDTGSWCRWKAYRQPYHNTH